MTEYIFRKKFISQLYELISSDIELIDAINIIKNNFDKKELKKILNLKRALEKGENLEKSFSNISLNKEFLIFITTSEKTGNLKENLKILNEKYELIYKIREQVKSLLIYPVIILITTFFVTFILLIFVVPKFILIYEDLNKKLPLITRIVINLSTFFKDNFIFFIAVIIILNISISFLAKKYKYTFDKLKLYLPLYKDILILNFNESMYSMLSSDITFLDALKLCSNNSNLHLKKEINRIIIKITKGESIRNVFVRSNFFDREYISYIVISDSTGKLDKTFKHLKIIYKNRTYKKINIYLKLLEPLSIIIISILIGSIVFSIILPLFSIGEDLI